MKGKQFTDLAQASALKDSDIIAVHDGNGLKQSNMEDVTVYMSDKFSNPNLLINPDFKINQRGKSEYTGSGYTVDRWKSWNITVTPNTNGGITLKNDSTSFGNIIQFLENATEDESTLSCYVTSLSGTVQIKADGGSQITLKQGLNILHTSKSTKSFTIHLNEKSSVTLKWVKLEQGTVATPFIAPNNNDELDKCLRYFESGSLDTAPGLAIQSTVYIRTYIHPKRINPTPKFSGDVSFEMNGTGKGLSLTYIGTDLNTECCTFKFKPSEVTQYGLGFCKNFAYEIDAEIYS